MLVCCPQCGSQMYASDAFCGNCGATLTTQRQPRRRAATRVLFLAAAVGALVVLSATGWWALRTGLLGIGWASVQKVTGVDESVARDMLQSQGGFVAEIRAEYDDEASEGQVIGQDPLPNTRLKRGSTVVLTVSKGRSPTVTVPDVIGVASEEARARLEATDLGLEIGERRLDADIGENRVVEQEPAASEEVPRGSTVMVHLSAGPPAEVPDVVDMGLAQAQAQVEAAGLAPQLKESVHDRTIAAGRVKSQWPRAGEIVAQGTIVFLVKSTGPPPPPLRNRGVGRGRSCGSGNCRDCHGR